MSQSSMRAAGGGRSRGFLRASVLALLCVVQPDMNVSAASVVFGRAASENEARVGANARPREPPILPVLGPAAAPSGIVPPLSLPENANTRVVEADEFGLDNFFSLHDEDEHELQQPLAQVAQPPAAQTDAGAPVDRTMKAHLSDWLAKHAGVEREETKMHGAEGREKRLADVDKPGDAALPKYFSLVIKPEKELQKLREEARNFFLQRPASAETTASSSSNSGFYIHREEDEDLSSGSPTPTQDADVTAGYLARLPEPYTRPPSIDEVD